MAIPADQWNALCAYSAPAFDPLRGETLPEQLGAGDVLDDGSIMMEDGTLLAHGMVWMREEQATAAAYYGWARVTHFSVGTNLATGQMVLPMGRWPS